MTRQPQDPERSSAGGLSRRDETRSRSPSESSSEGLAHHRMIFGETMFRTLYDSTHDAVVLLDGSRFLDCNPATLTMFGCATLEEFCAKHPADLSPPTQPDGTDSPTLASRHIATALAKGRHRFEWLHKRADTGEVFPASVQLTTLELDDKRLLLAIVGNITERRQMETRITQTLMHQQAILDVSPIGISLNKGRIIQWSNPAHCAMFGYSAEELRGMDTRAFFVRQEDYERVGREMAAQMARGQVYALENEFKRKNGERFWCFAQGRALEPRDLSAGMIWMLMDITQRKGLEAQFLQAQKMEAVGQLAGGVAHDFNNILSATLMHLGLLLQNPLLLPDTKESLREVEAETLRAANLTRQLLLFSRRKAARTELLELDVLINDLLKMLRRLLGEDIEIAFQGRPGAIWVCADSGMMEQVVMNLCPNARDAMSKGGRLTLATTIVEIEAPSARLKPDARPGRFVCLSVADNGCGMEETVLQKIFEPFFTTKEPGKGTGLGLATVYGIVKQHEGWIEAESTVGQGSSFRVYLPAARPPAASAIRRQSEEIKGGSETVLLVEDDLFLRRVVALSLRKLGYAILEAANGIEALKVWEKHHQRIELLLTDMVMPETMTGLDLAERLKKEKSSLKVIISSGYGADWLGSQPKSGWPIAFLPKPYTPAALARTVRHCLDKA